MKKKLTKRATGAPKKSKATPRGMTKGAAAAPRKRAVARRARPAAPRAGATMQEAIATSVAELIAVTEVLREMAEEMRAVVRRALQDQGDVEALIITESDEEEQEGGEEEE